MVRLSREFVVRVVMAGLLSTAALLGITAIPADAAKKTNKFRSQCDAYCQRYPSATPRQLKNARAYDRGGEYWEQDPNAHPVGSAGWWYLQDRRRGVPF